MTVEKLAAFYGIPFEHVPVTAATRAEAEAQQFELLARHDVELVVLARYMQILSPVLWDGIRRRLSTCTTHFCRRLPGRGPTTRRTRGA